MPLFKLKLDYRNHKKGDVVELYDLPGYLGTPLEDIKADVKEEVTTVPELIEPDPVKEIKVKFDSAKVVDLNEPVEVEKPKSKKKRRKY